MGCFFRNICDKFPDRNIREELVYYKKIGIWESSHVEYLLFILTLLPILILYKIFSTIFNYREIYYENSSSI